jgi:hypothetical protein
MDARSTVMSGLTREQLAKQVTSLERSLAKALETGTNLEGELAQGRYREKRLAGEIADLRELVHSGELTIAHMRGKLSMIDRPEPLEPPPQPPVQQSNHWDHPLERFVIMGASDPFGRRGLTMTVADGDAERSAPWYRRGS